jgi:Lar family restriction alleviation protein
VSATNADLLPCPFCGRSDLLGFEPRPESGFMGVRCRACGAIGPGGRATEGETTAQAEAAAHWNRRVLSPPFAASWRPSIGAEVEPIKHPGQTGTVIEYRTGSRLPWVVRRHADGTETGYAAHEIRSVDAHGMRELRAAFEALGQPEDAPSVLRLLLRAVREVLGCDPPRAVWGPGAPELRIEVDHLLTARESIASIGASVGDRWLALIQAARLVVGRGRVWQRGDT